MTDDLAAFDQHRRLLFTVAYQMLGSVADAEDVVQDAWLRWSAADRGGVVDARAYLVRVTTRLALDRMNSARARRESYVGPWLPEPLLTGGAPVASAPPAPEPEDAAELGEQVSLALLVVLETLSPAERAVFVLREVFGMSVAEVAGSRRASGRGHGGPLHEGRQGRASPASLSGLATNSTCSTRPSARTSCSAMYGPASVHATTAGAPLISAISTRRPGMSAA